jgi:endonuclease/exonuclease/phosphatase family metal-dependent hydrolase
MVDGRARKGDPLSGLRVATWNIWGRFGDWERRWPGILHELRRVSPDVVGLVETWRDESRDQAQLLAHELGYGHWASTDVALSNGLPWGVGVLSRLPIVAARRLEFPNTRWERVPGVALLASIEARFGAFEVACVCEWGSLGQPLYGPRESSDRRSSYRVLVAELAAMEREVPPLLVGDLNTLPDSDEFRALTGKVAHVDIEFGFNDAWELVQGLQGGGDLRHL